MFYNKRTLPSGHYVLVNWRMRLLHVLKLPTCRSVLFFFVSGLEIEIERAHAEAPATQPCLKKCQILIHDSSRGTWPTITATGFKRHTANRSCSLSSSRKSSSTSPIIGDHTLLWIWWPRTTLSCRYTPSLCQTRARHCQYPHVRRSILAEGTSRFELCITSCTSVHD